MIRLFADTSGLFAALVQNDRMHTAAEPVLRKLLLKKAKIHVTSYVLLETVALLQSRVGLSAARQFEHAFRPALQVAWVDAKLHDRAFRRLELRGQRGLSLVDCCSFVAMEDLGLQQVFGYDDHFAEEGFDVVGNCLWD